MKWPMVKLHELISSDGLFTDGDWVESKDQDPNGDVRLIQLADIGLGYFTNKSDRYLTKEKALELNCTFLNSGDILIARMPDPIGRACIFPQLNKECVTVVDICVVRPKNENVDSKWLMHCINSRGFNNQILNYVTGTTRQRISRGNLSNLNIAFPPLEEQKRIAAILDKADAIRQNRQQAIALADDFLRSVFLDMFVRAADNWTVKTIDYIADKEKGGLRTGPFGSQLLHSEFVDSGIPVLGIDNAVENIFKWGKARFITDEKYKSLSRYTVHPEDVLITIMGTCGRCAVVPDDIPTAINTKHLCCISLDYKKALPEFLHSYYLFHPMSRQYLEKVTKGAIMDGLNMGLIKAMPFPMVPIKLQEKYVEIKMNVLSSLDKQRLSESYQEDLFNSLSQQFFVGKCLTA